MTQALRLPQEPAPRKQNRKQRRLAERQARKLGKAKTASAAEPARLAEAGAHHVAGRLAEAEALYRQVLASHPEDSVALARLGALCAQTERNAEAVELLERAHAADPSQAPTLTNLAIALAAEGQIERADGCMREALRLAPTDLEVQKNYSSWCHKLGRLEEAATVLQSALAAAPDDLPRQNLLGQIHIALSQLDLARQRLELALSLFPEATELHANLGSVLVQQGEIDAGLPHLARGMPFAGHTREYQALFVETLIQASPQGFGPELEPAMLKIMRDNLVAPQTMAAAMGSRLWIKYVRDGRREEQAPGAAPKLHMDGILADPLLLEMLDKVVCISIGLESFLVPLRRTMLFVARQQGTLSEGAIRFMACFAMQCHNNSYVFSFAEDERAELDRLGTDIRARIESGAPIDQAFETQIALFGMYRPLHRIEGFERLVELSLASWSAPMQPLIQRSLLNPTEEEALKPTVPTFGSIDDQVSQAVRSQYEENPYPRWVSLPQSETFDLAGYLGIGMPWIDVTDCPADEEVNGLIAGCGTGKHPISAAMAMPSARFTAIDLSLSSIAYAKRMALSYDVQNLEFLHGDILDVEALGRQFLVIESAGVLHHMEQPELGLASLMKVLRHGGYFKLGLYSEPARQFVTRARSRIRELGLKPTAGAIRAFRQSVLEGREPGIEDMIRMSDFFDLDSFRDLVFHVQEHQFTIPKIQDLLARNGLTFLGFCSLPAPTYEAFQSRFPKRESLADLDCWDSFERENQSTFVSMYQFWCRKA